MTKGQKIRLLESLNEDEFRDNILIPLFSTQGYSPVSSYHGAREEGKDILMRREVAFGRFEYEAIQAKVTPINLSRKQSQSIIECITQLKTILSTEITDLPSKSSCKPDKAWLITSKEINEQAKRHIREHVEAQIEFMDRNEIIPEIDRHFPLLWNSFHGDKFPYAQKLKGYLMSVDDVVKLPVRGSLVSPLEDEVFMPVTCISQTFTVHDGPDMDMKFEELTLEDLKQKRGVTVILGDRGDGKTTLLRKIAISLCDDMLTGIKDDNYRYPILLESSQIQADDTIHNVIQAAQIVSGLNDIPITEDDFCKGNITLLVDGLSRDYKILIDQMNMLNTLAHDYPISVIVTHDTSEFPLSEMGGSNVFQLSKLSLNSALGVIRAAARGEAISNHRKQELMRTLYQHVGLQLNPLLLACFINGTEINVSDLAPNVTQILGKFVSLLLGEWDESKGLGSQIDYAIKKKVLSKIARFLQEMQIDYMSLAIFRQLVADILLQIGQESMEADVVKELLNSGLIISEGLHDRLKFRHSMFRDFFVALDVEHISDIEIHVNDSQWRNIFVFYFGLDGGKSAELEHMVKNAESEANFKGLVTVGYVLQASYLVNISSRGELYSRVLSRFGSWVVEHFENELSPGNPGSASFARMFYASLLIRLAMSCQILAKGLIEPRELEYGEQWCLALALIESGNFEQLAKFIDVFDTDRYLNVAIFLAASYVVDVKYCSSDEKSRARVLRDKLQPVFHCFRRGIIKELQELPKSSNFNILQLPEPE